MILPRISSGFQVVKESFVLLWQHKILAAYMAIATFLFALIQYILSSNFIYTVKEADKITDSQMRTWSTTIDQSFASVLISDKQYFLFISLVLIYSFVMTFFVVCLIKHVLQMLENRSFAFSLLSGKASSIITWSLLISVLQVFTILAEMNYWGRLYSAIIIWSVMLFIQIFGAFVLPIIADASLNIFKAILLSLQIIRRCWIELLTALIVIILPWLLLVFFFTWFIANLIDVNFAQLILMLWIPLIIWITIKGIVNTLLYRKFYKKA